MIGNAFRNEASPRQGLLRTREFTLAEIEYFFNPHQPFSPNSFSDSYQTIKNELIPVWTSENQKNNDKIQLKTIESLYEEKIIKNEIVLHFFYKIIKFLKNSGIKMEKMRFREHNKNEMAHYANGCWDIEIHTENYNWIECIGIADRTNFDLYQHGKFSNLKKNFQFFSQFSESKTVEFAKVKAKQPAFGKHFRSSASSILNHFENLSQDELQALYNSWASNKNLQIKVADQTFSLTEDLIDFTNEKISISG